MARLSILILAKQYREIELNSPSIHSWLPAVSLGIQPRESGNGWTVVISGADPAGAILQL
jgi:hypothetical protein